MIVLGSGTAWRPGAPCARWPRHCVTRSWPSGVSQAPLPPVPPICAVTTGRPKQRPSSSTSSHAQGGRTVHRADSRRDRSVLLDAFEQVDLAGTHPSPRASRRCATSGSRRSHRPPAISHLGLLFRPPSPAGRPHTTLTPGWTVICLTGTIALAAGRRHVATERVSRTPPPLRVRRPVRLAVLACTFPSWQ